jgi:hypothetical protein
VTPGVYLINFKTESAMAEEQQAAQESAAPQETSIPFSKMDGSQKLAFIGKAFIFLITWGFAYPTLFSD